MSGMKSSCRPVSNGTPQRPILRLILLNIFINTLDNGTECTLSSIAHDTKLGGFIDRPDGCIAIQRTLTGWRKGLKGTS